MLIQIYYKNLIFLNLQKIQLKKIKENSKKFQANILIKELKRISINKQLKMY